MSKYTFNPKQAGIAAASLSFKSTLAGSVLPEGQVVRTKRLQSVIDEHFKLESLAAELLGSVEAARTWVKRPIPSLDGLTPSKLNETPEGKASLENYMNQIRYGVYI